MEIQFLGTSSGVPTKTRNVSAIAIAESQGKHWYLVDCGEGTQHQLLSSHLTLNSLQAVFITHVHGDHCYGLPGLLASAGMNGRTDPLKIVAPRGIKEWFEATQTQTQLFLPYELEFLSSESLSSDRFGQFSVRSNELSHRVPSFAYCFEEAEVALALDTSKLIEHGVPQGPMWGKLRSGKDVEFDGQIFRSVDFTVAENRARKVIVCGDNDDPTTLDSIISECQVLIHESTYIQDMSEKAALAGHSYAKQIAEYAETKGIPNLLLTHFSPRFQAGVSQGLSIADLEFEAKSSYSGNLYLAEDYQRYQLQRSGQLALSG